MNILTLTSSYPRWSGDYAGNFVQELVEALRLKGHQVTVIAPDSDSVQQDATSGVQRVTYAPRPLMKLFYGAGAPENIIRNPWVLTLVPLAGLALYRRVYSLITNDTTLFTHWLFPAAVIGGLLFGRVKRHIIMVHSTDLALLEHLPLRGHLARWFIKRSHTIVFASQNLHQRFVACVNKGQHVLHAPYTHEYHLSTIPMGVWNKNYQTMAVRTAPPPLRLLFVGRLVPIKGVETLLRAVAPSDPIHITIVGDGPLRPCLQSMADKRNLAVEFKGRLTPEEVKGELARAHALVLPSLELPSGRTEGAPRVILEALSAGLPVVASRSGGIPELIPSGARHLLFSSGDTQQLRQIIIGLVQNPRMLSVLEQESREFSKRFDWNDIAGRFEEVLASSQEVGT